MSTCAICVEPIEGHPIFEPLGRDDGLVAVCPRCASEEITPKDPNAARRGQVAKRSVAVNERALRIRERRELLRARGICVNGETHGAIVPPSTTYCASCAVSARQRSARSRAR